jgi:cell division protein FtsZ
MKRKRAKTVKNIKTKKRTEKIKNRKVGCIKYKEKVVLPLEVPLAPMEPEKKVFQETYYRKPKIRIIGVGGGAGSIISEIASKVKWADFVVANTDERALSSIGKKLKKFQFGQELTKGLGTGMNSIVGEQAAQNEKEKIKKIFEGQDICIILACLGGGTSSGATPVFAKMAKDCGCLSFGIFTLPFEFEGENKMEIARQSLEKIKPCLNVYSVIPNERIFNIIEKNAPLKTALSAINAKLSENIEGLIGMIHCPGLINIDFADLKAVLAGRGRLAYLNMTTISEDGDDQFSEDGNQQENIVDKIISDSLYTYNIKGAKGILYNIIGGNDLRLAEVSRISEMIFKSINKNAKIIFGISQRPDLPRDRAGRNKVKVAMLAVGCGLKNVPSVLPAEAPIRLPEKYVVKSAVARAVSFRKKMSLKKRIPFIKKSSYAKAVADKPAEKHASGKFIVEQQKEKVAQIGSRSSSSYEKEKLIQITSSGIIDGKIRRNALQLKKEADEEQRELMDQEMILETPAILRKK